jgi:hypothetical protein
MGIVSVYPPYISSRDIDTLHEAIVCSATKNYYLDNYELVKSTSTIDVYKCNLIPRRLSPTQMKYIIIVIKTRDICLSSEYWNLFVAFKYNFTNLEKYFDGSILQNNSFYEDTKADINSVISLYPKPEYEYNAVAQGTGGAILDDLIINNYIDYGVSFNPLIESKNFKDRVYGILYNSELYYSSGSPFANTFAKYISNAQILPFKLRWDDYDNRWIYINERPILVSNSIENETFYMGPSLRKWTSIEMTYDGQYQLATTIDGLLFRSDNFGQSWSISMSNPTSVSFAGFNVTKDKIYSKVKIAHTGIIALFLQDNDLYISKTVGSTWEIVPDFKNKIGRYYNDFLYSAHLYISYEGQTLIVYIPTSNTGSLPPFLYISEDGGDSWFDFTKRKFSHNYIFFKNEILPMYLNSGGLMYTNESDLDLPIPTGNKWCSYKYILGFTKYLWSKDKQYISGLDPIFSFNGLFENNIYDPLIFDTHDTWLSDAPHKVAYNCDVRYILTYNINPANNTSSAGDSGGSGSGSNGGSNKSIPIRKRYLWCSNDSGVTWRTPIGSNHNWTCVNMSYGGSSQIAAYYDSKTSCGIYVSKDYGVTWTLLNNYPYRWSSVSISSDGRHLSAVCDEMLYPSKLLPSTPYKTLSGGFICVSFNGGVTWKERR